jgi:hypothetical protein
MHYYVQILQSLPSFKTASHCPITLCTTTSRSFNLLPPSKLCPIVPLVYTLLPPDPSISFLLQNRVPLSHYYIHCNVQIFSNPPSFKTVSHCLITTCTTTFRFFSVFPPLKLCPTITLLYILQSPVLLNLSFPSKPCPIVLLLHILLCPVYFNPPSKPCPIVPLLYALLRPDPSISYPCKTVSHCPITPCTTTNLSFQSPPTFKTVSQCPITLCSTTFNFFQSLLLSVLTSELEKVTLL